MALILAIEPDKKQASAVRALARGALNAQMLVADSTAHGLHQLDGRIPDLILTSLLLSPKDESALDKHLRGLDAEGHRVPTLVIPVLGPLSRSKGGLLTRLKKPKKTTGTEGCDPATFAAQITEYLDRAAAERALDEPDDDEPPIAARPRRTSIRNAEPEPTTFEPVSSVDSAPAVDSDSAFERPVAQAAHEEPVPERIAERFDIELRGDDGRAVADGEIGDLYIRGPSAALMYWANREKSRDTFQGAWTKSGDKYVRNADGTYTYSGRSDDMLKVSGQYVSPFEVEATLVQHQAVLEAAVIGVPDAEGLTRTKAYVVLKPGQVASDALEAELKAFVKERLAPHKYPRQLTFIAELPKTATGKIQRFRLREAEAVDR